MRIFFLISCFLSLFFNETLYASNIKEFKYTSFLRGVSQENKIHRVLLSLEVLSKIEKTELADLRIFNQDNVEVPYLIYNFSKKKEYNEFSIYNPETQKDENFNTVIDIHDLNIPCDSIFFEIDSPYYYREVDIYTKIENKKFVLLKKSIISKVADIEEEKNIIDTNIKKISDLRIKIINKDSPALSIKKIKILCEKRNIVFIPTNNNLYSLYYGSDIVSKPRYDLEKIVAFKNKTIEDIPLMTLGGVNKNIKYSKKVNYSKGILFFTIILLVISMLYWIHKLIKKLD